MQKEQDEKKPELIFSVSEFIELLNIGLNKSQVKMIGEVSDMKVNSSGHVYFVLKDKKDGSIIDCVIWKYKYTICGIKIEKGMEIIIFGHPNVHKIYGFSFIAETIELAGEGVLKKEYEKLKKKLTEEGLFDEAKKRKLPKYPQKIGLITSKKGAVLGDFLSNIGKFGFKITMIDSRVEGQIAAEDLLCSIKTFKKQDIDVLAIIRGGGSSEAIEVFNNELLIREVASFPVPVIVAIGHNKDKPLINFAADVSVSTPSIVATTLNAHWIQAQWLLERYERAIINSFDKTLDDAHSLIIQTINDIYESGNLIIERYKKIEHSLMVSFGSFRNTLLNVRVSLKNSFDKSFFGFKTMLSRANSQLEHAEKIINLNNPERQLTLGYSIARYNGKILKSIKNTKVGDNIDIQMADGEISSEAKRIIFSSSPSPLFFQKRGLGK